MATQVTPLVISVLRMPAGPLGTPTTPGKNDSQRFTAMVVTPSKAAEFPGQRYSLRITGDDVYLAFITTGGTAATTSDMLVANGSLVQWSPVVGQTDVVSVLPAAGTFVAILWCSGGPQ